MKKRFLFLTLTLFFITNVWGTSSAPQTKGEPTTLIDEKFSALTQGTDENPDFSVPLNSNQLHALLTAIPGTETYKWGLGGGLAYPAGSSLYLPSSPLVTPWFDGQAAGTINISIKIKSKKATDTFGIRFQPYLAQEVIEKVVVNNTWQTYNVSFSAAAGDFQWFFNEKGVDSFFIDDLLVTLEEGAGGDVTTSLPIPFKETFNGLANGSQEDILVWEGMTDIINDNAIDALADNAGWTGEGIYEAAGTALIGMTATSFFYGGGKLTSPAIEHSQDKTIIVSLKLKHGAAPPAPDIDFVITCNGSNAQNIPSIKYADGWQDYSVSFQDIPTGDIKFEFQAGFLPNFPCFIDSIEIFYEEAAPVQLVELPLIEGFDKFTATDETDITVEYKVPEAFTNTPGWSGSKVSQAGGAAKINSMGGLLQTPKISGYDGKKPVVISVRAKAADKESDTLKLDGTAEVKDIAITNEWAIYTCSFLTLPAGDIRFVFTPNTWSADPAAIIIDSIDIRYADVIAGDSAGFGADLTNLHWTITADSILTVSGTGGMAPFTNTAANVFHRGTQNYTKVKTLVIKSGVTGITAFAFADLPNLKTVLKFPSSVTSLGWYAFQNCTSLEEISFTEYNFDFSEIGQYAFDGCTSLETITLPKLLKKIGIGAFANCSALTDINSDGLFFYSVDGVLYNDDTTNLVVYPAGKDASFTIPSTVDTINSGAFIGATKLDTLLIHGAVASIEASAFKGCTGLTDVYVSWQTPIVIAASVFDGVATANVGLHIPEGTLATYQAADVWKSFKLIAPGAVNNENIVVAEDLSFFVSGNNLSAKNVEFGSIIEIFNVAGQKVLQRVYTGGTINIGNLPRGLYVVRVGGVSVKIVK